MALIVDTKARPDPGSGPSEEASPVAAVPVAPVRLALVRLAPVPVAPVPVPPVPPAFQEDPLWGEQWRGPSDSAWLRRILRGAGLAPEMPPWFGEVRSPGLEVAPPDAALVTDRATDDGMSAGA